MNDVTQSIAFSVDGEPDDRFRAFACQGLSEISRPFAYTVDLVSYSNDLDLRALLGKTARLTVTSGGHAHTVNGMVAEFRLMRAGQHGSCLYQAVLGPRLLRLKDSANCQIFGTRDPVSVTDVIEMVMTATALKGPIEGEAGRFAGSDFEIRTIRDYPKRDYLVQYNETDFDFLSRLTEHWGIAYYFEHRGGRDIVVFGDDDVSYRQAHDISELSYRPSSGMPATGGRTAMEFSSRARPLPRTVCLRDYNDQTPHLSLYAEAEVDPKGRGAVVSYGDHFESNEEGMRLAGVRAEEILCRGMTFDGTSDCPHLSAGEVFTLSGHFRGDFNASYIVTRIEERATVALPEVPDVEGRKFSNAFTCIPVSLPLTPPRKISFRPARVTPKPTVAGLMNAMIDGETSDNRAQVNESGCYRIRQPFDLRGEQDGQSSPHVRKMEPYGGASGGMHYPLLKGTEVVIACVNGDPDRPVIVGTVPNPRNPSVTNSTSSTTNRIRTTSGIAFEMRDGPASAQTATALPGMLSPKPSWTGSSGAGSQEQ